LAGDKTQSQPSVSFHVEKIKMTRRIYASVCEKSRIIDDSQPITKLKEIHEKDVPAFNQLVREQAVPAIMVSKKA